MLPAVPPTLTAYAAHLALTNISLPCNVEKTVRTTLCSNTATLCPYSSHERLRRELRLVSDECNFQHPTGLHISGGFCQSTFLGHCL